MEKYLPYTQHQVDEDDVQAVINALRSGWVTGGPLVDEFERRFAEAVQADQAVACSSGTAGLHLAMLALGVKPGTRVAVPAITFLATANAVLLAGGEVEFVDIDPATGLMSCNGLAAVSGHLDGVLPVHMNGQSTPMAEIRELANARSAWVVEDAAHALGTRYQDAVGEWVSVGACRYAEMVVFSLHPAKSITMGEGGMVALQDAELAQRVRRFRSHGMVREPGLFQDHGQALDSESQPNSWYYEMHELGLNYRASDINCALGLSQLRKLHRHTARRRLLVEQYDRLIGERLPMVTPLMRNSTCDAAWHLYPIFLDFDALGTSRASLMRSLAKRGIGTQVHYLPLYRQPYYRARYGAIRLPGAESYYERVLSLPLFPAMDEADVERVVDTLGELLNRA